MTASCFSREYRFKTSSSLPKEVRLEVLFGSDTCFCLLSFSCLSFCCSLHGIEDAYPDDLTLFVAIRPVPAEAVLFACNEEATCDDLEGTLGAPSLVPRGNPRMLWV